DGSVHVVKRAEEALFFSIEDDETQSPCRIGVVAAPVIAHGVSYSELDSAATTIVICRVCRNSLSIVVTANYYHLFRLHRSRYTDLHIKRWHSCGPILPTFYRKLVDAYLGSKPR